MPGHANVHPFMHQVSDIDVDRALAAKSFRDYIDIVWPIVEPSRAFTAGWHVDAIAEHVQAVYNYEIENLVINVPPGSTKSLTVSVFFPTWVWTQSPEYRFICASYNDLLIYRDARKAKRLIKSKFYQERWPVKILPGEDTTSRYANEAGGFRQSITPKGGGTGEHAHIQIIDDPSKPMEAMGTIAETSVSLGDVETWRAETLSTRFIEQNHPRRITVMQRLNVRDMAGLEIADGAELLMLPMEFEPKRKCYTSIGWEDPRTEEGELLCPERFNADAVAKLKRTLGPRGTAAQLQQNPNIEGGDKIKEEWFRYYYERPQDVRCETMIQSWDLAFKDEKDSDFVSGHVWGVVDGECYYLLDRVRGRMDIVDTCKAIVEMSAKWPKARLKLVEDKANGPAVMQLLKRKVAGFKAFPGKGVAQSSKTAYVNAVAPLWESGNVFVPNPETHPWVADEFRPEVTNFPNWPNDDDVDSMSHALVYLSEKKLSRLKEAMRNARLGLV